eukprot:2574085-Karenia_brevis.AAC.1
MDYVDFDHHFAAKRKDEQERLALWNEWKNKLGDEDGACMHNVPVLLMTLACAGSSRAAWLGDRMMT